MDYSGDSSVAEKEWLKEISSGLGARDLDARPDPRTGIRPRKPSIHSLHPSRIIAENRPSIGRRIFRTVTRFSITVLIGVGGTLAWQSHGDEAMEMLQQQAPMLAQWLPVSTTQPPVAAAPSPDPAQQLRPLIAPLIEPLASNLDAVRRSVDQLAARQEQLAQDIAALRAVEEDVKQKVSSPPPPPVQPAAATPQPKPPQPRAHSSAAQSSSAPRPPAGAASPAR